MIETAIMLEEMVLALVPLISSGSLAVGAVVLLSSLV